MDNNRFKKAQENAKRFRERQNRSLMSADTADSGNNDKAWNKAKDYFRTRYVPKKAEEYYKDVREYGKAFNSDGFKSSTELDKMQQDREDAFNRNKKFALAQVQLSGRAGNDTMSDIYGKTVEAGKSYDKAIKSMRDYYSQFDSEDDYNSYRDYRKKLDTNVQNERLQLLSQNAFAPLNPEKPYSDSNEVKERYNRIEEAKATQDFERNMQNPDFRREYEEYEKFMEEYNKKDGFGKALSQAGNAVTNFLNNSVTDVYSFAEAGNNVLNSIFGVNTYDEDLATNKLFNYVHETNDTQQKMSGFYDAGLKSDMTKAVGNEQAGEIIGSAISIALNSIPDALSSAALASMTGGASTAGTMLTATSGLSKTEQISQITTKALKSLAKDPNFYYSFLREGGSAYNDAKKAGADEASALIAMLSTGFGNSLIEIGGGIEAIPKLKNATSVKEFIKGVAGAAGEEAMEEVKQGIVSQLIAKATYAPESELFSLSQDGSGVINPLRMLQEAYGGAVGGMFGGALGQTLNVVNYNKAQADYKAYRASQGVTISAMQSIANAFPNSDLSGNLVKIQTARQNGQKVSKSDYAQLYDSFISAANEVSKAKTGRLLGSYISNPAEIKAVTEPISRLFDGEKITADEAKRVVSSKGALQMLSELTGNDVRNFSAAELLNAADNEFFRNNSGTSTGNVIADLVVKENQSAEKAKQIIAGAKEQYNNSLIGEFEGAVPAENAYIKSVSTKGGETFVTLSNGKVKSVSALQLSPVTTAVLEYAGKYDTDTANLFVDEFAGKNNISVGEYASAFDSAFRAGAMGVDITKTASYAPNIVAALGNKTFTAVYNAGRAYTAAHSAGYASQISSLRQMQPIIPRGAKVRTEAVSVPKAVRNTALFVAKATGYNVVLYDGSTQGGNALGSFSAGKGEIAIDISKGNTVATALHEVTHFIEVNAPEQFKQLTAYIAEWLTKNGSLDSYLNKYTEMYRDISDNINDISAEMAADATEALIKNDSFVEDLLSDSKFINSLAASRPSIVRQFINKLQSIIKAIKDFISRGEVNHTLAKRLSEDVTALSEYEKLWTSAFKQAVVNREGENKGGEDNADSTEATKSKFSITEEMSEDERYTELKDKSIRITVPSEFNSEKIAVISDKVKEYIESHNLNISSVDDLNEYLSNNFNEYSKIIRNIANSLGINKVDYSNSSIRFDSETSTFKSTNNSFDASIHHQKDFGGAPEEFITMLSCLESLITNAQLIEVHGNYKENNKRGLKRTYVLISAYCDQNKNIVPVQFEVQEYENNSDSKLYLSVVLSKIKEPSVKGLAVTDKGKHTYLLEGSDISLSHLFANVNTYDSKFLKYVPDEFLSEEQIKSKRQAQSKDYNNYQRYSDIFYTDDSGNIIEKQTGTVYYRNEVKENSDTSSDLKKFSLSGDIEQVGELVAVHNLGSSQILKCLDLGGLPAPSIAVTKAKLGHSNFGDISLVFSSDTINPEKDSRNDVFSGDGYTSLFPSTDYKYKESILRDIADTLGFTLSELESNYFDGHDLQYIVERMADDRRIREKFLELNNIEVKPVPQKATFRERVNGYAKKFLKDNDISFKDLVYSEEVRNRFFAETTANGKFIKLRKKNIDSYTDILNRCKSDKALFSKHEANFNYDKAVAMDKAEPVYTEVSRIEGIENAIKEHESELVSWLNKLVSPAIDGLYIRRATDLYKSDGTRKSFDETHYAYSLENLVKAMKRGNNKTSDLLGTSIGEIRATMTEKFDSLDGIRSKSGKIQDFSTEVYESAVKKYNDLLHSLVRYSHNPESFSAIDTAAGNIIDAFSKYASDSKIKEYIKKYYPKVPDSVLDMVIDFRSMLLSMPVKYFEAKPFRAVSFDEVRYAIVPSDIDSNIKQRLEEYGIALIEYEKGNEESRKEKLNSLTDVKFSLPESDTEEISRLMRENEHLRETVETLKAEMKLTKGHKVSPAAVKRLARKFKQSYKASIDINELTADLECVFNYIAGENAVGDIAQKAMYTIAKKIISTSAEVDTELKDSYKSVSDIIRNTTLHVTPEMKQELEYIYGSYESFRRSMFGKLRLSLTEGKGVDVLMGELAELDGYFYGSDAMSDKDMIPFLCDFYDMIEPKPVYGDTMAADEAQSILASEIFESYFATPGIKTFADKQQAKLDALRRKQRKAIDRVKQNAKERYDKRLKAVKAENDEKISRYQQKINDLRKKQDKQSRELKAEMYRRIGELRSAKNQKLLEQKAIYRERAREQAQKARETEERAKYKRTITKNAKDLIKWFDENSDTHHIPENLRGVVAEFVGSIDFLSEKQHQNAKNGIISANTAYWTEAAERLHRVLSDSTADDEEASEIDLDLDPDFLPTLSEFIEGNKDIKRLSELNAQQLRELDYLMAILKNAVQHINKLYLNRMAKNVEQLGNDTIGALKAKKERTAKSAVGDTLDKLLNMEMLDAFSYFSQLGKAGESIMQEFTDGFNRRVQHLREARDYMKAALLGVDIKEIRTWTGDKAKVHEFDLGSGKLRITTAQVMSLYELWKREQAKEHITKGGVVPTAFGRGKNKQRQKTAGIRISEEELTQIFAVLTPQQIEIADKIQRFMSDNAGSWGNETSMQMYGYKKFTEKDYFPIKSSDNVVRSSDSNTGNDGLYSLKNKGMTKKTVKNANNALMIDDIFDVFTGHIADMANYNAYVMPLMDAMKWYNYKTGKETVDSVKQELERVYGTQAKRYFINFIRAINGADSSPQSSEISDTLTGKMKAASVAANVRVAIQQPTAIARAAVVIDPKYLLSGSTKMLASPLKSIAEAEKYSGMAQWKSWGYYETGIGKSLKEVITGVVDIKDKLVEKSMILAEYGDKLTWGALWEACKAQVKAENKGIDTKSDEYFGKVTELFDSTINKTQVIDTVFHRSQIMRSKDGAVKMATAFMSEPTKTYNLMRNAIVELYHNNSKENKQKLARSFTATVCTALLTAAAAAVADAFRDTDDDKDWAEKYIENFWDNVVDNVNPLNMIPYFKDIVSAFQGYDVERSDVGALVGSVQFLQDIIGKVGEGKDINWFNAFYTLCRYTSQLTGIPVYNLLREADTVIDMFGEPIFRKKPKTTAAARYEKLYGALTSGDTKGYDKLYDELIADGKTPAQIESGLRSQLTSPDSPIYNADFISAAESRMEGNLSEYERLLSKIKSDTGLSKDFIVKTVNTAINKLGKEDAAYIVGQKKQQLIDSGISEAIVYNMSDEELDKAITDITADETAGDRITSGETMSVYTASDFKKPLQELDKESFKAVYEDIYTAKVEKYIADGYTEKQAKKSAESAVKAYITQIAKPIAKELYATDKTGYSKLRTFLVRYGGYDSKTVNGWTYNK